MLVACLGRLVGRLHIVVLLPRDGLVGQQLLEAVELAPGVVHPDLGLVDAGIADAQIVLHGGDAHRGGLSPGRGVGKIGLGLRQTQTELGILDHKQSVAPADLGKIVETNLADETLNARADRRYVPAHLSVVGVFDVAQMHKSAAHIDGSAHQQADDKQVESYFSGSVKRHDISFL